MGKKHRNTTELTVGYAFAGTHLDRFAGSLGRAPASRPAPARIYTQEEVEANRAALAKRLEDERADETGIHEQVPTDPAALMAWIRSKAKS